MEDCNPCAIAMEVSLKFSHEANSKVVDQALWQRTCWWFDIFGNYQAANKLFCWYIVKNYEFSEMVHENETKRQFRYIKGTRHFGLTLEKGADFRLIGFTYVDQAGFVDDRKLIFGYTYNIF